MLAQVYWNSHKKCYSVRDKKTRKVILHTAELSIQNATFHVSMAGYKRRIREGVKNVYAWIEGEVMSWDFGVLYMEHSGMEEYSEHHVIGFKKTHFDKCSGWDLYDTSRKIVSCSWLLLDRWDGKRTITETNKPRMLAYKPKYQKVQDKLLLITK